MSHHLTETSFDSFVENSTKPVLVMFKAVWCGPCKALVPIIDAIEQEKKDDVEIATVDIDESPSLAQDRGIRGVPTIICYKGGNESGRIVGLAPKARILSLL